MNMLIKNLLHLIVNKQMQINCVLLITCNEKIKQSSRDTIKTPIHKNGQTRHKIVIKYSAFRWQPYNVLELLYNNITIINIKNNININVIFNSQAF